MVQTELCLLTAVWNFTRRNTSSVTIRLNTLLLFLNSLCYLFTLRYLQHGYVFLCSLHCTPSVGNNHQRQMTAQYSVNTETESTSAFKKNVMTKKFTTYIEWSSTCHMTYWCCMLWQADGMRITHVATAKDSLPITLVASNFVICEF